MSDGTGESGGPSALEQIAGYVAHAAEQIPVHRAAALTAKEYASDTAAWAAEKGVGRQHGLFYSSAQVAVAKGEAAVKALDLAKHAMDEFRAALIQMGA